MSFTSPALLQKNIDAKFLENFEVAHPEVLANIILQCDRIITRKTGLQPPTTPAVNQEELQLCAAWIVTYLLTPHQAGLDEKELKRRADDYDRAMEQLAENENVTNGSSYDITQAARVNTKRIGEMP